MTFKETMANLFSASEGAYYKWKRENRPIIQLIDRYFSKDDIQEFLKTGKINKQEIVKNLSIDDLESISSLKQELIKKEIELHKQRIEELEIKLNNTGGNK